ncbi:MAG: hypothetical protein JF620_12695, partial [Mesorhizobium sp.]|nr:hypothetical protein [Mesorhizobium sp.]
MTMISEPDVPAIELGHREAAPGRPSRARMIGVLAVGAALVTFVNVTAAVYLYRGVNDLKTMEARLEQLGQFEQRIGARIDTVNNGFQSRFETLDHQLQGSFIEINGHMARLEQNLPVAGDAGISSEPEPAAAASTVAEASSDIEVAAEPAAVDTPRPPKRRIATAPPAPNPGYQRTETPD